VVSAGSSFAALFHAADRSWDSPPSEVSPHRNRGRLAPSSMTSARRPPPRRRDRRHQLPCDSPPHPPCEIASALHRRFRRRPFEERTPLPLAALPRRLWLPFRIASTGLPQLLRPFPVAVNLSGLDRRSGVASSAAKPCSSCESVLTRRSCPRHAADPLLGVLAPLKPSPPAPWTLGPASLPSRPIPREFPRELSNDWLTRHG
jgi:hypothetical protein